MKTHTFNVDEIEGQMLNQLLISAVSPRPIALVSSIDNSGKVNLSPFSFFNIFSFNPPILIFSPSRRSRDNTTKHTYENVIQVPQVSISIVNYAMGQQIALASNRFPKEVNEFEKAGLTPIKSNVVAPPYVGEAPISFECIVDQVLSLGNEAGSGNLVISKIVKIHINDSCYCPDNLVDLEKLDLIGRMGGSYYCSTRSESRFEIKNPETPIGIGFDQLPKHALGSDVLTGNILGKLASMAQVPSQESLEICRANPEIEIIFEQKELEEKITLLHHKIKDLIKKEQFEEALCCLFLIQ